LLSGIYRAEKSHYCPALSAGQGYGWARARLPNHPQATREHFENHPTHDCESILQSANPMSWDRTPLGCTRAALPKGGYRWSRKSCRNDLVITNTKRRDPARLNPRRERRDTLVSRRDNTVLLGCSGYRKDTSGKTPARHGRPCWRDLTRQRETD